MKRIRSIHWLGVIAMAVAAGLALTAAFEAPATHAQPSDAAKPKAKILVYSQSFGFRHSVVARPLTGELSHAEKVLKRVLSKAGYEVFLSQDHNDLNGDQFKNYDAIIFYTSGDPAINRENLMKWLENGGALIGVHSATDTYKGWPEYVKAMGAAFKGHGAQKEATIKIEDKDHSATRMLGSHWKLLDEYYLFGDTCSRDNVHVLMSIDTEATPNADLEAMQMKPGGDYPLAWTNKVGKGRVFYSALGHREDVWTNPKFQEHFLGGIAWTLEK